MSLHSPCSEQEDNSNSPEKPCLVILLAWLTSTDRYLDKYRKLYLSRGYDILTIRTQIPQIMLPANGSQVIAKNLMLFLRSNSKQYSNFIVHGFSVGAYQFSEFLVLLKIGMETPEEAECLAIKNKFRGVIFDSAVSAHSAPHGVAVSTVGNNPVCHIIELLINLFLALMYPFTMKHYLMAEDTFKNTPLRCPAALLCSRRDTIGDVVSNKLILDSWIRLGISVVWKCWDSSQHVAHMKTYPQEYTDIVNQFLGTLAYESLTP
jgi:hypothetical protein